MNWYDLKDLVVAALWLGLAGGIAVAIYKSSLYSRVARWKPFKQAVIGFFESVNGLLIGCLVLAAVFGSIWATYFGLLVIVNELFGYDARVCDLTASGAWEKFTCGLTHVLAFLGGIYNCMAVLFTIERLYFRSKRSRET